MLHAPGPLRAGLAGGSVITDHPATDHPTDHSTRDADAFYGGHLVAESICPSNQRRIIACWNACLDVPTEVLETSRAGGLPWSVPEQLDRMRERATLIEALEKAREALDDAQGNLDPEKCFITKVNAAIAEALDKADAALLLVKGEEKL